MQKESLKNLFIILCNGYQKLIVSVLLFNRALLLTTRSKHEENRI